MLNFICQNEVNVANEPLKVEKPLLESSTEMDKLTYINNTAHSPVTKITVMVTNLNYNLCCVFFSKFCQISMISIIVVFY